MYQCWQVMMLISGLLLSSNAWAVDSYRFLHVTIDTPWYIFIFLFFLVFAPMILLAVLHWHNALKRNQEKSDGQLEGQHEEGDSVEATNKHS